MILGLFFLTALAFSASSENVVYDMPKALSSQLGKDELPFVAEIPEGTFHKFELRSSTGVLFLDRTLCPRRIPGTDRTLQAFPVSYGITPGRFNIDGDPLDLIVAGAGETYRANAKGLSKSPTARKVRVIGILKMDECEAPPCKGKQWQQDYKVLAVDPADKAFKNIQDARDLSEDFRKTVSEFFAHYKGQKAGKPYTRVTGYADQATALKFIEKNFRLLSPRAAETQAAKCESVMNELFARYHLSKAEKPQKISKNAEYLGCAQRGPSNGIKPDSVGFDFFVKYGAAQRALELGEDNVTLDNAISKHEQRKAAGKTYYRFVGQDLPSPPGTGRAVYEWVKTKSRNEGCPPDFPAQHYESRPLIDLGG